MSSLQATSSPVDADVRTLTDLFAWRVGRTPAALACREFDRAAGAWVDFSLMLQRSEKSLEIQYALRSCFRRRGHDFGRGARPVRQGASRASPRWCRISSSSCFEGTDSDSNGVGPRMMDKRMDMMETMMQMMMDREGAPPAGK